jgi:hypothetical protein
MQKIIIEIARINIFKKVRVLEILKSSKESKKSVAATEY